MLVGTVDVEICMNDLDGEPDVWYLFKPPTTLTPYVEFQRFNHRTQWLDLRQALIRFTQSLTHPSSLAPGLVGCW